METRKRPKETRKRSNKGNGRDDWAGKGNCMLYSHLENVSIGSSFLVEQSVNCFAVTTYVPEKSVREKELIGLLTFVHHNRESTVKLAHSGGNIW